MENKLSNTRARKHFLNVCKVKIMQLPLTYPSKYSISGLLWLFWRSSIASGIWYFRYFLERYKDTIFPDPFAIDCIYAIHLMSFLINSPQTMPVKRKGLRNVKENEKTGNSILNKKQRKNLYCFSKIGVWVWTGRDRTYLLRLKSERQKIIVYLLSGLKMSHWSFKAKIITETSHS